jgi:hypothetical protein
MEGMDAERNTPSQLPAVLPPLPVLRARGLPERLRQMGRHPVVAGAVAAAGLLLHASLRRALTPRAAVGAGGSPLPAMPTEAARNGAFLLVRRTEVVEAWIVRGQRS